MKKIKVDKIKCIGCGACVGLDSEHFDFEDSGLSEVISQENLESEDLQNAIEGCPTGAISVDEASEEIQDATVVEEESEEEIAA